MILGRRATGLQLCRDVLARICKLLVVCLILGLPAHLGSLVLLTPLLVEVQEEEESTKTRGEESLLHATGLPRSGLHGLHHPLDLTVAPTSRARSLACFAEQPPRLLRAGVCLRC